MPQYSSNRVIVIGLLFWGVLFLTFSLFYAGLYGGLVLDDLTSVMPLRVAGDLPAADGLWLSLILGDHSGSLGRSVSIASFLGTIISHGYSIWWLKYDNVAIHLINGCLLFWLLLRLVRLGGSARETYQQLLGCFFVAVIWLLHPLQISTVLYVVQRMTSLSTLFVFASLLTYVIAKSQSDGRKLFLLYTLFPFFWGTALLAKETAALLPFYILIIEFVFLSNNPFKARLLLEKAFAWVFLLFPILVGVVYFLAHTDSFLNYSIRSFSLAERLSTQLYVVLMYLKMMFLPLLRDMTLYHDDISIVQPFSGLFWVLLSIWLFLVGLFGFLFRHNRVLLACALFFVAGNLLESTVFPLELMFEHRTYLVLVIAPVVLLQLVRIVDVKLLVIPLVLWTLMLSVQTALRAGVWSDNNSMALVLIEEHPNSQRATSAYINSMLEQEKYQEALDGITVAIDRFPETNGYVYQLMMIYCIFGNVAPVDLYDMAYERALKYPADNFTTTGINSLNIAIETHGCKVDINYLDRIISRLAVHEESIGDLRRKEILLRLRGQLNTLISDYDAVVRLFTESYRMRMNPVSLLELIRYQVSVNRLDDAEASLELIKANGYGVKHNFDVRVAGEIIEDARNKLSDL